jgi:hypothetical protein
MTDMTVTQTPNAAQKTDVPQTLAFVATPADGNGTVVYQWQITRDGANYVNATGTGNATNEYTYTSVVGDIKVTGQVKIRCKCVDDKPTTAYSTPVNVTVAAAIAITHIPASPQTIMNTEGMSIIPTVIGGMNASNFAYLWQTCSVDGGNQAALSPSITTATILHTPTASGVVYLILRITESGLTSNNVVYSTVFTLTVASFYTTLAGATGYLAKIAHAVGQ